MKMMLGRIEDSAALVIHGSSNKPKAQTHFFSAMRINFPRTQPSHLEASHRVAPGLSIVDRAFEEQLRNMNQHPVAPSYPPIIFRIGQLGNRPPGPVRIAF